MPPPPALLDTAVGSALGTWASARLLCAPAARPLHAAVLGSEPLAAALHAASRGGSVVEQLTGDAAAAGASDLVLVWTSALPTAAQLRASLLALRPGGVLVLPAAHDDGASAAACVRARVHAAKAAGAREYGACPAACRAAVPGGGAAGELLRAVATAASELGVLGVLVASSEALDTQVDLTGLADAPPSRAALATVSALLDIDAAALASRSPSAFAALVDELRSLSLFNAAPARAAAAGDRPRAARGAGAVVAARSAARVHVHVPLHCVVLQRLLSAPAAESPDETGASMGSSSLASLWAPPLDTGPHHQGLLRLGSGGGAGPFDPRLPPGCEYVAAAPRAPPSRLRPLQLLLSEPGVARKLADGSVSVRAAHLGLESPPTARAARAPPPPPPPPREQGGQEEEQDGGLLLQQQPPPAAAAGGGWVALDVCFPLGGSGGFFNLGFARWQSRRLAWSSGRAWRSPGAAAAGGPPRRARRRAPAAAAAAAAVETAASPADGAPTALGEEEALYELLVQHEFSSSLELPGGAVGLAEMVATLVDVWADAGAAGGADARGDDGAGSASSAW
jgi:hypothetical protein